MKQLDHELAVIRKHASETLKGLQAQADALADETHKTLKETVARHGFQWCEKCDGTGALERLDSGYMRRFGLKEWDGCKACGGSVDEKGRGYV